MSLRKQINALSGSLAEIRREKAALLAELALLRYELRRHTQAVKTTDAQASPQAAPRAVHPLLGKIGFSSGSAKIDAVNMQTLSDIAVRHTRTPGARLLVEGTSDSSPMGARAADRYGYKTGLAMARALSVFRALKELGVEQKRMVLAASAQADYGQAAGRTVRIWLIPASNS